MTWTATISNPAYNYTGSGKQATDVPIATFTKGHSFDSVSYLTLYIRTDVASLYDIETDDANNALQLNSTVILQRDGAYWFRGYVHEKPYYHNYEEGRYLVVQCMGWDGILLQSLIVDGDGNNIWTLETSKYALTQLPLTATSAWGSFQGSTLWPDPSDSTALKCYTNGASDTLYVDGVGGNLSASATTIILTTSNQGFVPRGWVLIDSEWIYFDGYDNANVDTRYRLYNCVRGQLGTTAATHAEGATVQEKLGKEIAPSSITLQNNPGTGWVTMRRGKEYDVHTKIGCYVLAETASGSYRATYSVYDEDSSLDAGSVAISLNTIVKTILKGGLEYGGAGLSDSDLDLSAATGLLKVNRYDYDPTVKPIYAYNAIQALLNELSVEDEIKFWYKHSTGKFRLNVIANAAASFTVPNVTSVEKSVALEDIYSAVRVEYTDDQDLNRAVKEYAWHQAATGSGSVPDYYKYCATGGESWNWTNPTITTSAGNDGIEYCVDGKPGSKLGAVFTHNFTAGVPVDHSHYWFGTGAPQVELDNIKLTVGNYRQCGPGYMDVYNDQNSYIVRVQGCTDYNATTHVGTWFDIGLELEGKPSPEGTSVTAESSVFTQRRVNAIRVVWDYMPGPKEYNEYYGVLHDIDIKANVTQYALIQLSDDAGDIGDPLYLYAPESYEKLRGGVLASTGTAGAQRVKQELIGASSSAAAISIGRILLLTSLRQFGMRRYTYEGVLPGTPELGITVSIDETDTVTYTGVLRQYVCSVSENGVAVVFGTVLDASADVIE